MSRKASVSAPLATLALSLGALAPTSGTAQAAAACNAAPKPAAPAGSHWYYRTDRAAGRKCWYLAAQGSKGRIAAPRGAETPDADEDTDTSADTKPAAAPMAEVAARLTEPLSSPPPATVAVPTSTIVSQAAPSAPLLPPAEAAPRSDQPASAALVQEPAARVAQEPAVDQTPAPVAAPAVSAAVAPASSAPVAERVNAMQFVFVAFVGMCLLAGFFFYLAALRRRRMEVRIVDLNTRAPLRTPAMATMTDAPSVAPDTRRDDGEIDDERLRRFSQAWKRQAA